MGFVCLLVGGAFPALAGTLEGRVTDSMTGTPIADATVRVLGTDRESVTDADGQWSFELPEGEYQLRVEVTLGETSHTFRVVNQHVPQYKPPDTHLPTDHFLERGVPRTAHPLGAPVPRIPHPSSTGGPVDLDDLPGDDSDPTHYTLPDSPPVALRVARREDESTCRDSPIVAIEEIPLESYVPGVLAPEIGVFRNQPGGEEVFEAFAPAATSYGVWFFLRHRADQPRRVDEPKPPHGYESFHLDDTPCNQRYSDMRFEKTDAAAERMAGKLLVKEGAPDTVDKFEYAASCGGHGTRPEYQSSIVADDPQTTSCVGDWCGHETCAGHADHPDVAGEDRCLVRGICQWGALEWAESGRAPEWLLEHYQPNLAVRDLGAERPETTTLSGFVYTDPADIPGSAIAGARVDLEDGPRTTSNQAGRYTFRDVELSRGSISLTASRPGYTPSSRTTTLTAGETNWVSLRLVEEQSRPVDSAEPRPDASSPNDAGARADRRAGGDAPTRGSSSPGGPYGRLGPMIAPSSGSRTGCHTPLQDERPSRPSPWSMGLAILGLLVFVSRTGQ